ncbi:hypothetical protein KIW84_055122 [Lathyrus oleraceus]|uniref:MULE transposase domain-containing protein n=1 Tax=Pisum sativum TaxID=3888 RepID=A0A9D4WXW5_PEA|nr:hypothetical protein KIW84_055122 [Pisum sativum]
MDSTCKTNKYRKPLLEIVGMTSIELTFIVAFVYMEYEQTENFCWVLEKLKELFVKKDLCPQVILTDRDLALMKAIEIVFPMSINLLCRFHINKNVGAKCKQYVVNDMQKTIDTLWMKVLKQMLGNSIGDMVKSWKAMNNNLRKICGCTLRTSYGLPCACELERYALGGISIPIDVVHVHWRKLTMEVELEVGANDGSEVDMTCAIDELWKWFRSVDIIGKRALKSRAYELAYPTMTPLCPPPEKLKTKEGVKKKGKKPAEYDVYRDPSYHEYVDKALQSSQSQSQPSQTSKKLKLSKKQPQSKKHFTLQFPNHIRSYIKDVVNVISNGNCGFRVIASLHRYGEDGWSMVRRDLGSEIIYKDRSTLYDKLFYNRLSEVREYLMIESLVHSHQKNG